MPGSPERQGFVSTVSALITEFKRYNVGPEDLLQAAESLEEGNPLQDKLRELSAVYARFEETIAARYRDADDDLTLAAAKFDEIGLYKRSGDLLDGLPDFTPQDISLSLIAAQGSEGNISLLSDTCRKRGFQKPITLRVGKVPTHGG